jgi:beta-ureidopropionase / N-carbamoyl-L-amino-acid hydrolase
MRNLAINTERLWNDLMETAAIGGTAKGGICRLTLTDLDRQVRDWFRQRMEALGCTVTVDDMGAMFARRPGFGTQIPPIAMGSHLDTQPTGGKFDGVLGVLAAVEALRTMVEAGYETHAPIEVVNWTNEEGSRFAPALIASGVFAGAFDPDWARGQKDRAGITFDEALRAIGYRGPERCGVHPLSAFFELHIEQGPVLEAEGMEIGIVTGVQGVRWFDVTITGAEAHTGATPMTLRRNALLGAARMIERIDAIARAHAPLAVGTVGMIEASPNSRNVVPGGAFFGVDLRHPEDEVLDVMEEELEQALREVCEPLDLAAALNRIWGNPPVHFDPGCIAAVRHGAAVSGFTTRDITSGAAHDAAYVSRVAPAAMIFVPSRDGISHNEAEFTSKEQCGAGAQVLLQSVLAYDQMLAEAAGGSKGALSS